MSLSLLGDISYHSSGWEKRRIQNTQFINCLELYGSSFWLSFAYIILRFLLALFTVTPAQKTDQFIEEINVNFLLSKITEVLEVLKTTNYTYNLGFMSAFLIYRVTIQSHHEMLPEGYKGVKILW